MIFLHCVILVLSLVFSTVLAVYGCDDYSHLCFEENPRDYCNLPRALVMCPKSCGRCTDGHYDGNAQPGHNFQQNSHSNNIYDQERAHEDADEREFIQIGWTSIHMSPGNSDYAGQIDPIYFGGSSSIVSPGYSNIAGQRDPIYIGGSSFKGTPEQSSIADPTDPISILSSLIKGTPGQSSITDSTHPINIGSSLKKVTPGQSSIKDSTHPINIQHRSMEVTPGQSSITDSTHPINIGSSSMKVTPGQSSITDSTPPINIVHSSVKVTPGQSSITDSTHPINIGSSSMNEDTMHHIKNGSRSKKVAPVQSSSAGTKHPIHAGGSSMKVAPGQPRIVAPMHHINTGSSSMKVAPGQPRTVAPMHHINTGSSSMKVNIPIFDLGPSSRAFIREQVDKILNVINGKDSNGKYNKTTKDVKQEIINDKKGINKSKVKDCDQLYKQGQTSVENAKIYPYSVSPLKHVSVRCDQISEGGRWTVIQSRNASLKTDSKVDFDRNWDDYVKGFGKLDVDNDGEYWIGLEALRYLTSGGSQELLISLEDHAGNKKWAKYQTFSVGGPGTNYKLTVDGYSGDAGDSLEYHNDQPFSTADKDNDKLAINCAEKYSGGWWFRGCHRSNLNGVHASSPGRPTENGIIWVSFKDYDISMHTVTMMIRPRAK